MQPIPFPTELRTAPRKQTVAEFLRALLTPFTYQPHQNTDVLFGFLWGLPVPIVVLGIHLAASGEECRWETCMNILARHPAYLFFMAHPILFGAVFGALGTMRTHRERRIHALCLDVQRRCEDLRKANDRLAELDRLKTRFLANVTHELKSPLVTALGYTDRILGKHLGEITERQQKGLEVGKRNLIRLRDLIDEMLDFSRLEAGFEKCAMAPVNLLDAVKTAQASLNARVREHDLTLTTQFPAEPAWVLGDLQRLTQVVTNLLDNAVKFSPEAGRVRIEVKEERGQCYLIISDQGLGVPPSELPKLFERFQQAQGEPTRHQNGLGLGLVIVKKIVDGHGGRVWLESRPGAGTKAHVELPALNVSLAKPVECLSNSNHAPFSAP